MSASVHFNLSDQDYNSDDELYKELDYQKDNQKLEQKHRLKRSFSLVPERFNASQQQTNVNKTIIWMCECFVKCVVFLIVIVTFPLSLLLSMHVITQYQRAVVFRLGRLVSKDPLGPGLIFVIPGLDVMKRIDLRTLTFDIPTQEALTKDSVTVAVDAVVYYRIFDPIMSVINVEDASRSTRLLAQTTLRNVLGTVDLCSLLRDREEIAACMQETLDTATDTWGMKVERVEIKDVRLPMQLQRVMAAEAEATREAKAKVIAAEGEHKAAKSLREAAEEIFKCPIAIQLRYLQTLNSISAEKNSTIIFPVPLDILSFFQSSNKTGRSQSKTVNNETLPINIQRRYNEQVLADKYMYNNDLTLSDADFNV